MSAQSERIRAALQRSKNPTGEPPSTKNPAAEAPLPTVEATLPLIAATDQNRTAPPRFEPARPSLATRVEAPAAKLETPPASGSRRILMVAIGAALVLAGVTALLLRNHWSAPKQSAQTAPSGLQVKVEPQSNGLIDVQWNPKSELVTQAREGRLVISETNQGPRVVALNAEQLRSGHVYYQSSADRIEFRLEVVSATGATTQESVLALSSKSGATPPVEAPPSAAHASSVPAGVQNVQNIPANTDSAQLTGVPPASQSSRPTARPYIPLQTNQPSPGNASTISLDPPAPVSAIAMIPAGAALDDRLNVPAPQAAPTQAPSISVGGNVQAPKLIKKITPQYPALARAARARGAVRFTATIGKDGRIKNLQLVSGNPTLVSAATDAVKQWVYQPSLLNGEPVEVITQIEVNFSMNP